MPTVKKQVPPPPPPKRTPRPSSTPGSVLSEGIPVGDLDSDFIKIVLYGQNRVGKTTLACQFPKPLLLVAMEPNKTGGAMSVTKVKDVTYLRVSSSEKAVRLAVELKQSNPFATVVVDSVTSYQDIILREILGLTSLPEMLSWGTVSMDQYRMRSEKTREALRPFIDLDCHVVLNAKERDHNPPKDGKPEILHGIQVESFFAADLGGATVGWLNDACDYICRLYIEKEMKIVTSTAVPGEPMERLEETGRLVRRLRTMYHPNFAAGIRSATPEKVPEFIQDPTFEKIYKVIRGV